MCEGVGVEGQEVGEEGGSRDLNVLSLLGMVNNPLTTTKDCLLNSGMSHQNR